jgi:hypothetical protein
MKRLVSFPLAVSLAVALPFFAYAASDDAASGGTGQNRPAVSGGASGPTTDAGTGSPAGSMAAQSHSKDGLSRNKEDCAKTGCVDNGGN